MPCKRTSCYHIGVIRDKNDMPKDCLNCEYGNILKFFKSRILLTPFGSDPLQRRKNDYYVYQYRTIDDFWKIVESDSLFATHVRFSNDHAEQRIGIEYFQELFTTVRKKEIKDITKTDAEIPLESPAIVPEDCYLICFSKNGDILSQWRGYSPEGGVAIGFDLSNIRPFSILKRDRDEKKNDAYHIQLNGCFEVKYISGDPKREDNPFPTLSDMNSSLILKESRKLIPYLKHNGFAEEEEFRLLFHNEGGVLTDAIHYRPHKGQRIPFIKVYAGDATLKKGDVTVRVALGPTGPQFDDIQSLIGTSLEGNGGHLVNCCSKSQSSPDHCRGCTIRYKETRDTDALSVHSIPCAWHTERTRTRHWVDKKACGIYISQGEKQREIYEAVKRALHPLREDPNLALRIWCDGHLPIRKLVVGPSRNQNDLIESIRHYCDNTWWLNDVGVTGSGIPFRG